MTSYVASGSPAVPQPSFLSLPALSFPSFCRKFRTWQWHWDSPWAHLRLLKSFPYPSDMSMCAQCPTTLTASSYHFTGMILKHSRCTNIFFCFSILFPAWEGICQWYEALLRVLLILHLIALQALAAQKLSFLFTLIQQQCRNRHSTESSELAAAFLAMLAFLSECDLGVGSNNSRISDNKHPSLDDCATLRC